MIHVHLGVNVVNFHDEEVEINSLDQHPTESGHQEILHQSCYCNTGSLWKERVFVYFLTVQRVNSFYRQKERPLARPSGEEDDLSSSKGRRNTQSNLRERLTKISDEIIVKKKRKWRIRQKQKRQWQQHTEDMIWSNVRDGAWNVAWIGELSNMHVLVCVESCIEISLLSSRVKES